MFAATARMGIGAMADGGGSMPDAFNFRDVMTKAGLFTCSAGFIWAAVLLNDLNASHRILTIEVSRLEQQVKEKLGDIQAQNYAQNTDLRTLDGRMTNLEFVVRYSRPPSASGP